MQKPFTKIHGEKFGDLALTSAVYEQLTKDKVVKESKDISFNFDEFTDKEKAFYDKWVVDKWKIDINKKNAKYDLLNKRNGFLAGGLVLSIIGGTSFVSGIAFIATTNSALITIPGPIATSLGAIITPLSAIPFYYYYYTNNIYKKTYGVKVSFNAGYNFIDKAVAVNVTFKF